MKSFKNEQRNYIKMQESVLFVKKSLKINMLKQSNIEKLEIVVIIQVNIEVLHISYVI